MNKEKIKNTLYALWDDIVVLAISFFGGSILGRCFNIFGEQSIKVFVTAIAIYCAYLAKSTKEDNSKFISKSIIYVIVIQLIYAFVIGNPLVDKIITWFLRTSVYVFFILFAIFFIVFWLVNRKKSPSDDEDVEIIEDIEDTKKQK